MALQHMSDRWHPLHLMPDQLQGALASCPAGLLVLWMAFASEVACMGKGLLPFPHHKIPAPFPAACALKLN
eukprot:1141134-Pelagomonas_calceolata.AAC.6